MQLLLLLLGVSWAWYRQAEGSDVVEINQPDVAPKTARVSK